MARKKGISYAQIRVQTGLWFAKNPDLTAKDLSEMTGVSEATLGVWKREDNWEKERTFYQSTPGAIERALLEELKSLADGNPPKLKADAISKVKSALALVQRDINPHITYSVLERLDKFIAEQHPELLDDRLNVHKEFLKNIIETYGGAG